MHRWKWESIYLADNASNMKVADSYFPVHGLNLFFRDTFALDKKKSAIKIVTMSCRNSYGWGVFSLFEKQSSSTVISRKT